MSELIRFGVSISESLIEPFDELIAREGYTNRSEALRDLIRERLIREREEGDGEMFGTLTLVYDHHARGLDGRLTEVQHEYGETVISAVHVHVDHDNCLQILILRGAAAEIRELSGRLKALRGVKHAALSLTSGGGLES